MHPSLWGLAAGSVVKNLPANAGEVGLMPGSRRSPEKEIATHPSILACKIPWTEEPGRPQFMELQSQTILSVTKIKTSIIVVLYRIVSLT